MLVRLVCVVRYSVCYAPTPTRGGLTRWTGPGFVCAVRVACRLLASVHSEARTAPRPPMQTPMQNAIWTVGDVVEISFLVNSLGHFFERSTEVF